MKRAVNPFISSFLDDEDADTARTTLGVPGSIQKLSDTTCTTIGTAPDFVATQAHATSGAKIVHATMHDANAGVAATLAVNGDAAKSVKQYTSAGAKTNPTWLDSQLCAFMDDGTDWILLNPLPPGNSYLTGQVVQVVQVVKSSTYSVSAAADTWYDVTDASASITPRNASNKILVMVNGLFDSSSGTIAACGRIVRGSTPIGLGAAVGSRIPSGFAMNHYNKPGFSMSGEQFLDSPAAVTAVSYKVQVLCGGASGGTIYVGQGTTDADSNQHPRVPLTITLMEVAG